MEKRGILIICLLGILLISFVSAGIFSDFLDKINKKSITGNVVITEDCTNVVALYHLDGNANDSSGNGNDGTIIGATSNPTGQVRGAFDFNGVDDYVDTSVTAPSNYDVSLSAWINVKDTQDFDSIVSAFSNGGIKWYLDGNAPPFGYCLYYREDSGTYDGGCTSRIMSENQWYHVAITFENDTQEIDLYIDGEFIITYTGTDGAYAIKNFYIGYNEDNAGYFNGSIDEVIIYNKSLSDTEISELYEVGVAGTAVSCGGAPAVCNDDGNCDTGETCSNCPNDCTITAAQVCCFGSVFNGDCCSSSDCIGSDVCITNVCTAPTPCTDVDGDTYGIGADLSQCSGSTTIVDCDDDNILINPGATEVCNDGLDNNCNGFCDIVGATCTDGSTDGDSWCSVPTGDTYYVSSTGQAQWADCLNTIPLNGITACSYSTANTNAQAGDTIYYRGGTYSISENGIAPYFSGSSYSNRITFSAYNNEPVIFVGASTSSQGVYLSGNIYIKVHGITFNNFMHPLLITDQSNYNEISNCVFDGFYSEASADWVGSRIRSDSTYNHVHHSTFSNYGYFEAGSGNDQGAVFGVGIEETTTDDTYYNLIEDNEFAHGGHHVVDINGHQNIWRNNYIRNDIWADYQGQDYGNRVIFTAGAWPLTGRNLIEGNRIAYGSEVADYEIGGSGGTVASNYNIIRKNLFYQNGIYGFKFDFYPPSAPAIENVVYSNVFWHNGYTVIETLKSNWEDYYASGLHFDNNDADVTGNIVKNNIFYDNKNTANLNEPITSATGSLSLQIISSNSKVTDPKFVDIIGAPELTNPSQWDFHLQETSPAINAGEFLTTITSASNSGTSFTVANSDYFFDGWTMEQITTASIVGDTIQLEGQSVTAVITNVDYTMNIIIVDTPLTWTTGQGVALAYEGSAPDIGAYEYVSTSLICAHEADIQPCDNCVDANELGDYVNLWFAGTSGVTIELVAQAIDAGDSC